MKCKRHPYEVGAGVCSSCLRERLLFLIAVQNGRSSEPRRLSLDSPPLAVFPRSVSPNIGHRRSAGAGSHTHSRFFSTPQAGPAARSERLVSYSYGSCKMSSGSGSGSGKKFSLLSALFGISRSDEIKPSPKSSSSSWFSGVITGRRKKKSNSHSQSKSKSLHDRGMSRARDDEDNESVCSSGYSSNSTESSTGWRHPEPTSVRNFPSRHGRGVSGFGVCLSPLVWPSSKPAAGLGISRDPRGGPNGLHQHRTHVSVGATSLVPSRWRKLADYGPFR